VSDEPASRAGRPWRPWTIWLPSALAVAWSGLLGLGTVYAVAINAAWGQPFDDRWIVVEAAGQGVLAAVAVALLVTGATRPRRRRAAVIAAWMIIPVAFGWLLLTARLNGGS
jgi:hypothetical protein